MSAAPRVVLDTNVVLSALVFASGRVSALRNGWHEKRFTPLASAATASELVRAIAYPRFKLSPPEQQELLAEYFSSCIVVKAGPRLPKVPACRDPGDLPFLQLAVSGKADYLVSGDKDLLAVAREFRCAIVPPAAFLRVLEGLQSR